MDRRRTIAVAVYGGLLAGVAVGGEPAPDATSGRADVELQKTRAGKQFAAFLPYFNEGDPNKLHAFFEEHLADANLIDGNVNRLVRIRELTGGLDPAWVLPSIDRHLAVQLKPRRSGNVFHLDLYLQRTAPHKIAEIKLRAAVLPIGAAAPPLGDTTTHLSGNRAATFEKGKVYVLEFWAPWCVPCLDLMPYLSQLAEQFRGDGVVFVGVATSHGNGGVTPEDYLRNHEKEISYAMVKDWGSATLRRYTDTSVPTVAVIDRNGRLAWIWPGSGAPLAGVLTDIVRERYVLPDSLLTPRMVPPVGSE